MMGSRRSEKSRRTGPAGRNACCRNAETRQQLRQRRRRSVRSEISPIAFPSSDLNEAGPPAFIAAQAIRRLSQRQPRHPQRQIDTKLAFDRQRLPRANHQSHARCGVTGQPSDSNRLSLRERWPRKSNHGRTQHGQTADFRHPSFLQQFSIMASATWRCIDVSVVAASLEHFSHGFHDPALRSRTKSADVNQTSFVEYFDCENHSVNDRSSALQ